MRKIALIISIIIISLLSCFDDSEPTVGVNLVFGSTIPQSRDITVSPAISHLYIAVFIENSFTYPVAKTSLQIEAGKTYSVTLRVPKAQVRVVAWGTNSSKQATYCGISSVYNVVDGSNNVNVPMYDLSSGINMVNNSSSGLSAPPAYTDISWQFDYNATSYSLYGSGNLIYTGTTASFYKLFIYYPSYTVVAHASYFGINTIEIGAAP